MAGRDQRKLACRAQYVEGIDAAFDYEINEAMQRGQVRVARIVARSDQGRNVSAKARIKWFHGFPFDAGTLSAYLSLLLALIERCNRSSSSVEACMCTRIASSAEAASPRSNAASIFSCSA